METQFKYKGKLFSTPNLEKKLKRMKLSIDDIEIVELEKKKDVPDEGMFNDDKQKVIVKAPDESSYIFFIPKDKPPIIDNLFKDLIYKDGLGVRGITEEYVKTLIIETEHTCTQAAEKPLQGFCGEFESHCAHF